MQTMKKLFVLILIASFPLLGLAQEKPSLREGKERPVQITKINPSQGDLQKIKQRRKSEPIIVNAPEEVHVVKLYVNMPPPNAKAYILYIGNRKIEEYGPFDEGIFFKAYDRKDLDLWAGQPLRFVLRNELIDLGLNFPSKEEIAALPVPDDKRLPELSDVLKSDKP